MPKKRIIFFILIYILSLNFENAFAETLAPLPETKSAQDFRAFKNVKIFAVSPLYSLPNTMENRIRMVFKAELEKIGQVIEVTVPDITGYNKSQATIRFSINNIRDINGAQLPFIQAALNIAMLTTIKKTGVEYLASVWSDQTFFNGQIDEKNIPNIELSVIDLLKQFVLDYKTVNKDTKLTFYLYKR